MQTRKVDIMKSVYLKLLFSIYLSLDSLPQIINLVNDYRSIFGKHADILQSIGLINH